MCIATREIMDSMFEAYYAHEGNLEPDDIPQTDEPVWILGKKYSAVDDLEEIRADIRSKIWLTYRKGFVPIGGGDGLTTDRGWGCMLRCGQMVLAQALVSLHLGRDWCWETDASEPVYLKILQKFEDKRQAPFSIHQIALMGASEGKEVGEWFGPNTVAQVLKKLLRYDDWSSITIHVALDNLVVVNEITQLCLHREPGDRTSLLNPWKPLLLIVPLRLGLTEINPIYVGGLQTSFKLRQSLGVIGGKPNLALYFIGCVDSEVIYLDPHTTQRAGSVEGKDTEEQIELDLTYHCKRASRINILAMDPSIALGSLVLWIGHCLRELSTVSPYRLPASSGMYEDGETVESSLKQCPIHKTRLPCAILTGQEPIQLKYTDKIIVFYFLYCLKWNCFLLLLFYPCKCFFCKTESDFIDLCQKIRDELITPEKQPLFEICTQRPEEWSPSIDVTAEEAIGACASFNDASKIYDSDEFEIL